MSESSNSSVQTPEKLSVQAMGNTVIVRLQVSHIDAENCQEVFSELTAIVESQTPALLILNLRRVRHFHSVGMGALIELRRAVQQAGGRLALCSLDPQVREPLAITRIDRLLEIHDSERVALAT